MNYVAFRKGIVASPVSIARNLWDTFVKAELLTKPAIVLFGIGFLPAIMMFYIFNCILYIIHSRRK
jgi:hypothetical protein